MQLTKGWSFAMLGEKKVGNSKVVNLYIRRRSKISPGGKYIGKNNGKMTKYK